MTGNSKKHISQDVVVAADLVTTDPVLTAPSPFAK
jgi:hypothetical protein